jgi:hypothetical protein
MTLEIFILLAIGAGVPIGALAFLMWHAHNEMRKAEARLREPFR